MNGQGIRRQIMLITMSCFVLSIILISFDLFKEKKDDSNNIKILESNIRNGYDDSLKYQVNTALSLIETLRKQYESEHISEEEMKKKIAEVIRNLRYEENGYFWVDSSDGTNIVLYGSEIEGTNRYDFQDMNGKYVVQEVIKKAKEGGGFTDYYFPREGETEPKPKRAYGIYYEKFDWIIGTGVYTDTIDDVIDTKTVEQNKARWEHLAKHLMIMSGIFIFTISATLIITKNIIDPVLYASAYAQSVSKSKFDGLIPKKYLCRSDEIGILIRSLNEMNQSIQKNILEKEHINQGLSLDNEFLNIILKTIGDGIVVIDKDYRVKTINETVRVLFQIDITDVEGLTFDKVFGFKDMNKDIIDNNSICNSKMECYLYRGDIELFVDGTFYKILKDDQSLDGYVYVFHNISESLEKNREIEYLNYHDQLTGLSNRRFFEMKAKELLKEKYYPLGLILSDLNALKLTNDSLGHLKGDELLVKYATVLQKHFADAEVVARIGGDEFAVLISKISEDILQERINEIKRELSACRVEDFPVSAAFGYAVYNNNIYSFAEIFKEADEKMYADKMIENNNVKNKILESIIQKYLEVFPKKKLEVHMVKEILNKFCIFLKLEDTVTKRVEKAALVYDIGYISIPYDKFEQNRKLTVKEKEQIQTHPASAFHVLKNISSYVEVAEIVLCHHENVDGSGYPRGLIGNQIPYESKVLAIVTDYCAMRGERAYRPSLTKEEAINELRKKVGVRYDSDLVLEFIHMLESDIGGMHENK